MVRRILRSPLAIILIVDVFAIAIIATGVLDRLVEDGVINKWSMGISVGTWSVLAYLVARAVILFLRNRKAFVAVAIGIAIAVLIAEVGLRLFHPGGSRLAFWLQHSDDFHHISPPGRELYHGTEQTTGEPIVVRTNADGFRTQYTRESFKSYETRIAVLGDSFTFGVFNLEDKANPAVLEKLLRERLERDDIAVLNAGVISYSPYLGRFVVDELLREYDPTHIIFLFDASDIGDDWEYERMAQTDGDGPRFPTTVIGSLFRQEARWDDHSAILQRIYVPYIFLRAFATHPIVMASSEHNPMIIHGLKIDGERQRDRFFIYRYPIEKTRPYFDRTLEHVTAMAESARDMGAQFVFVVPPRYHHWNPEEAPGNWESYAYSTNEPYQFAYLEYFDSKRDEVDYPILNLLSLFQEHADEGPFVYYFDAHWNASGHALAARGIADFLLDEGVVK